MVVSDLPPELSKLLGSDLRKGDREDALEQAESEKVRTSLCNSYQQENEFLLGMLSSSQSPL